MPARLANFAIRTTKLALAVVIAAWSVLLLAWLVLHWGILPRIEHWRPQIERHASQALGVPISIGEIEVRSSGWVPSMELRQVVVRDTAGREALRLPRVAAAVSARSLLALQPRFEQLLIDGAELEVRRDVNGGLHVAGIEFRSTDATNDDGTLADWFFAQHEFVIRGGRLRWVDEQRNAGPLELSDVTLLVRNGLRAHALRLDATPPPQWGDRFSINGQFRQPLLARAGDWRQWTGILHADLPRADVHRLRRHVTLPFELNEGDGALRAWLDLVAGEPRRATVDVSLADVSMRLQSGSEPLSFSRIEGRLQADRRTDGVTLSAERLSFATPDGLQWPAGMLKIAWQQLGDEPPTGGDFAADRLDLGLMSSIASRLPLGTALHQLLGELGAKGIASDVSAHWEGPLDAPQRYQAKANVRGLSVASRASPEGKGSVGRPGLSNADVELQLDERGGQARLAIANGSAEFPGVFEEPRLPLDQLDAQLVWKIEPPPQGFGSTKVELQVRKATFANHDAKGEFSAVWSTGPGVGLARGGRLPGLLDLNGKLDRGSAAAASRYLPLGIPQPARRYVQRAVKEGDITAASFKVKGDLWDFPFYAPKQNGEFRITLAVKDMAFDYVPSVPPGGDEPAWQSPWPGLTKVSGDLVFDRVSMQVKNVSAKLGAIEISKTAGGIRDLLNQPTVALEGSGRGALTDALRFVNSTPIGDWIHRALDTTTATGSADLRLALNLPLRDLATSTVDGTVTLAGNDLRVRPDTPLLAQARGKVQFTQRGFTVAGASARVLGGDATFEGGTQADGSLRFNGQGVATADALRSATELGLASRIASSLTGQTPFRLGLNFVQGATEISVTSSLAGMASSLPAPLGKSAEATLPMRYQVAVVPDRKASSTGIARRDTLRFELGNAVQAIYLRDITGDFPRVLQGAIAVGVGDAPPALPATGVQARASVGSFNADVWRPIAARLFAPTGAAAGAGSKSPPSSLDAADPSGGYAPTQIALRADEVVAEGRRLTRVVAGASFADGAWRVDLDSEQAAGKVEWRPDREGSPGRVHARLSRLVLPPAEDQSTIQSLLDAQPASVPALDIVVDDFDLRGRKLGRLEVEAVNRAPAAGEQSREWRLSKLALTTPEARFSATGQWINPSPTAKLRSVLDFQLDVADSGALLDRLGIGRAVKGGRGKLSGEVSWEGSPLSLDLASLSGNVNVGIDAGQFLKADPGAARLLGVLSLQSLPRRLNLDFRDVFQEGFAFDALNGDIRIARGVASTNNLRMRGVSAAVLMEGKADLNAETQDLRVVVVPELNAGTASLAYAVINPAIGLGTFLAQIFLRKPMMQAITREFHVTGNWSDPKVERVERKFNQPLPDEAPAASADQTSSPRTP